MASLALREAGIAWCSTDMLASMVQSHGVALGFSPEKTAAMAPYLRHFIFGVETVADHYLIEGDIITPAFVVGIRRELKKAMRSVFMGNTKLTVEALRLVPGWLATCEPAVHEGVRLNIIAASERLRDECVQTGCAYVEMGDGWDAGLVEAAGILQFARGSSPG